MRPIKFRGRDINTDEYRYGDFVRYVPMSSFPGIVSEDGFVCEVAPDTIAQLVGYDKDGKEVYEGDIVVEEFVDGYVKENIARLESMTQDPETSCFYFFPFPAPFTTLKEGES